MNKNQLFLALIIISASLVYFKQHAKSEALKKPRLSILTSIYNADEFIESFMEDIVRQTIFDQCQWIIINAASPGNEEAVIKKYAAKYKNIEYEKLESDPGLYAVWNMAIKKSKAEFLTNSNADDRLAPNAFEVFVSELEKDPELDLVYAESLITRYPNETFENNRSHCLWNVPEFSIKNMRVNLMGSAPVWRKSIHDRFGYFDENCVSAADWEMWLRALSKGSKFRKLPGQYGLYYENPHGISSGPERSIPRAIETQAIYNKYSYMFN